MPFISGIITQHIIMIVIIIVTVVAAVHISYSFTSAARSQYQLRSMLELYRTKTSCPEQDCRLFLEILAPSADFSSSHNCLMLCSSETVFTEIQRELGQLLLGNAERFEKPLEESMLEN